MFGYHLVPVTPDPSRPLPLFRGVVGLLLRVAIPVFFILQSCGGAGSDDAPLPGERRATVNLVEEFAWADTLVEARNLTLGDPAGRAFLGSGWSGNEGTPEDSFVWALGKSSALSLPLIAPRDLLLVLDLRPFTYPDSTRQKIEVLIEDRSIFKFELEPGARRAQAIPLPAAVLRSGPNPLTLSWAWSRSPEEVLGALDRRPLAAAVHGAWICETGDEGCLHQEPASRRPAAEASEEAADLDRAGPRAEGDRIWLPWGTRAELFLRIPARAELLAEVGIRGTGALELDVLSEGAGLEEQRLGRVDRSREVRYSLPSAPGWIRLRLTALGQEIDGGARLTLPRLAGFAPEDLELTEGLAISEDCAPAERPKHNDLVIYSIDTLRADRLGYRGGPVATPVLDAFAREALVFDDLIAQSPWTKASMASVFTGLWPPAHGAVNRRNRLEPGLVTLAELLNAEGWATAAIVTNPNITEDFGFRQGFEHFEYLGETVPAGGINEAVERFLADRQDDRSLFLWVHTLDPHSPYNPPDEFRRRVAPEISDELAESSLDVVNQLRGGRRAVTEAVMSDLWTLYDAEIAYADFAFGEFLDLLNRYGLGDATISVVSDHGEEFLEHGNLEHGRALHVESLDVPWLVRAPDLPARRVDEPAQHLDVLPTLLSWSGLKIPKGLHGHAWIASDGSLQPLREPRLIFSHLHLDGDERASVTDGRFKLMVTVRNGRAAQPRLFDVRDDRPETTDLANRFPVQTGRLLRLVRERLSGFSSRGQEVELDEETRKSLEALGYL